MDTTDTTNPIVQPESEDLNEALRSVAMLATVSISKWRGETTDHIATEKVKTDAGAHGNAGRFVKNIMASADKELKDLNSVLDAARASHYAMTLPWGGDTSARGPRLLPNEMFEKYVRTMSQHQQLAKEKLDALVAAYPACVAEAQKALGGLANTGDYPTPEQVRERFSLTFDWTPVPDVNGFKGLPPNWAKVLGNKLSERVTKMAEGAQAEAWRIARTRLEHAAERLGDEESKFKGSTIDKLVELPDLMKAFNVLRDPRMDEFHAWCEGHLRGWDAEDIRKHVGQRKTLLRTCLEGVAMLGGWGV